MSCILISIGISIGILISLCIIFNWYFVDIKIYNIRQLVSICFDFQLGLNFNWYRKCFTYLVSKYTIYFNWHQNIKYFLSLVSKCTNVSISIGITNFQFHIVSKILWYLKILFMYKWYLKIWLSIITIYVKNIFICIAYMQGELNISSIYRFMLSVPYIVEVDISSLCDTCV